MAPKRPVRPVTPPPVEPSIIAPGGPHSTRFVKVLPEEDAPIDQAISGFNKAATWIFWISLAVSALLLLTFLSDVSKGSATKLASNPNAGALTGHLGLLSTGLTASLMTLAMSVLVLSWEERPVGSYILAAGGILHIGLPWIIFATVGRTAATAAATQGIRQAGFMLAVLGAIKLAWDAYVWLKLLPDRMQQRAIVGVRVPVSEQAKLAASATVFSPCWHLSYCREVIRRQCPAFLAGTKCWKFGKGCFCDEEMITRIIAGSQPQIQLPERKKPVVRRGKPPCRQCYIYQEHQGLKLKWISPLALPLAVGLTGMIWPLYSLIWKAFGKAFNWLWSQIAFAPATRLGPHPKNSPPVGQLGPDEVAALAQNLGGLCLGFFILIVILRLVEIAIDRWGW